MHHCGCKQCYCYNSVSWKNQLCTKCFNKQHYKARLPTPNEFKAIDAEVCYTISAMDRNDLLKVKPIVCAVCHEERGSCLCLKSIQDKQNKMKYYNAKILEYDKISNIAKKFNIEATWHLDV